MKDEKWIREKLTPELLEGIAGGMSEHAEADFAIFLKSAKAGGFKKESVIKIFLETECDPGIYANYDSNKEEMIAFIDRVWDSL